MSFMSARLQAQHIASIVQPRRLVPWTIALLLGCGDVGSSPTSPLEPVTPQRTVVRDTPFAFVLSGNANPDFSQGPCNVVNEESGTGVALHLGTVTWASRENVSFCVDPNDPGLGEVTGEWAITASNGDVLRGSYQTVVHADFVAGTLEAQGDYLVSGGSGRFADAGGSGSVSVTGSLAPPFAVSGHFVGSITY